VGFSAAPAIEPAMKALRWLLGEVKTLIAVTLYFGACFVAIMLLKSLMLAQYGIAFNGLATAAIAALVTAKIVIVLQNVPFTRWARGYPAIVDVAVRTVVYTFATLLLLVVEHAFETRAEHGGFGPAFEAMVAQRDIHRIVATTLCVGLAFAAYNAFGVLKREVGPERLRTIFLGPRHAGG
jgi:hypothetical protein